MIKIFISIFLTLSTIYPYAQTDRKPTATVSGQSINVVPYRLYPTQNMWNFIKLNTRNGQMWQVQYSMESENRLVTNLNIEPLVSKDKESNDRFTLYPTQNMFTFILLDQLEGKTWQVQWSIDVESRFALPIE